MNTTPHGPCKDAFDQWIDGREFPGLNCAPMDSDLYTVFHAGWIAALRSSTGHAVAAQSAVGVRAEEIYAAYPRKVGRQDALRAIVKAAKQCRGGALDGGYAYLLERTQAYAAAVAKWSPADRYPTDRTGREFDAVPHPATWFNRGSYDDDPKEWQRGTATPSQFSKIQ